MTLLAQTFWMPPQASTTAGDVDWLFYFIYYVSAFFFVLIAVVMFWFMWRYRRRSHSDAVSGITHNNTLEITWSVVPSLLLIPMFWWGFTGFLDARTVPANPLEINVKAFKWSWQFFYPNGYDDKVLHVPANMPVKLTMSSDDVIHSLFIPAFRVKRDVLPSRYSFLWFNAKHQPDPNDPAAPNTFDLFCTEYCGTSHSDMVSKVVVHPTYEAWKEWLENADPLSEKNMTPEEYGLLTSGKVDELLKRRPDLQGRVDTLDRMGAQLWNKKGCNQCHSVVKNAAAMNGPTWWNLFGSERVFTSGEKAIADENYIRNSIKNPNGQLVAGYGAIMPAVAVKDREIDALIAYIKTLKD